MQQSQFFTDVRDILADTPERSSTSNTTYSYGEIRDAALASRDELVRMLWKGRRTPRQPFQLTVSSMVKDYTSPPDPVVPKDFWLLLAGEDSEGVYVPKQTDDRAQGYLALLDDMVTVQGGRFAGLTVTKVHYVATPTTDIRDIDQPFTDFPDAFYECVELMTVAKLLQKSDRGTAGQIEFIVREIVHMAATLT